MSDLDSTNEEASISIFGGSFIFNTLPLPLADAATSADNAPVISFIGSKRLFRNLSDKAKLAPLDETHMFENIEMLKPALLLIEPCSLSVNGQWHFFHHAPEQLKKVIALVDFAQSIKIPVAMYFNEEMVSLDAIERLAPINAVRFTSSQALHSSLENAFGGRNALINVPISLPGNFLDYSGPNKQFSIGLDGLGHIFQNPDKYQYLRDPLAQSVTIIDSEFHIFDTKLAQLRINLKAQIGGYLHPRLLPAFLARCEAYLLPERYRITPLKRAQKLLQALAMGVPVVSLWKPPETVTSFLRDIEAPLHLASDFIEALRKANDPALLKSGNQKAWQKKIADQHGYGHFLSALLEKAL